jgi:membrane associated rhomboid family serine protease
MFPLGDDNSDRRGFPWATYLLIVLNIVVFALFQGFGQNERFTYAYATVPQEILSGRDYRTEGARQEEPVTGREYFVPGLERTPIPVYLTLITAMFMHGGLAHLLGNLWFLYIFGDNVESRLGAFRYLIFYLLTGILAGLAHVGVSAMMQKGLMIPCLGASGAISGVLGGYVLLFPHRSVHVMMIRMVTTIPAWMAVGLWFVFQVISSAQFLGGTAGGVAYGAHIGGFIAGFLLVKLFDRGER